MPINRPRPVKSCTLNIDIESANLDDLRRELDLIRLRVMAHVDTSSVTCHNEHLEGSNGEAANFCLETTLEDTSENPPRDDVAPETRATHKKKEEGDPAPDLLAPMLCLVGRLENIIDQSDGVANLLRPGQNVSWNDLLLGNNIDWLGKAFHDAKRALKERAEWDKRR